MFVFLWGQLSFWAVIKFISTPASVLCFQSDIDRLIPLLIFGAAALLAGILALLLPETKDKNLPETLEDGENFGKLANVNLNLIRSSFQEYVMSCFKYAVYIPQLLLNSPSAEYPRYNWATRQLASGYENLNLTRDTLISPRVQLIFQALIEWAKIALTLDFCSPPTPQIFPVIHIII